MSGQELLGRKVLIIEDDPLLHTLLADKLAALRGQGATIIPTMNATEGMEKAKAEHPDLIMLDLAMPGINGFDFLELLRANPDLSATPVIVLSNLSGDADKKRAKDLGVIAYMVKADYTLEDITGAIREFLLGHALPAPEAKTPDIQKTSSGYMIYL